MLRDGAPEEDRFEGGFVDAVALNRLPRGSTAEVQVVVEVKG